MRFTIEQVLSGEANTFFDTFGYFLISGVMSQRDTSVLKKEFDTSVCRNTNLSRLGLKRKSFMGNTMMVPSLADNSPLIRDVMSKNRIFDVPDAIFGKNYRYWGSDGSLFAYGSLWHRDTALLGRQLKMNFYLSGGGKHSGAFAIIPGSQHMLDKYGNNIGHLCAWPNQAHSGGMAESGLIPSSNNPNSFKYAYGFRGKSGSLPHQLIEFKKGDVICFDNRAVHCVPRPVIPKMRRLITMMFSEYPSHPKTKHEKEICKQANILKQLECNEYNVPAISDEMKHFFNSIGKSAACNDLGDIKPSGENEWTGFHKSQSDDLKGFLTCNYRPM